MAEAAYRRAAQLCSFGSQIVGVGATCALATVGRCWAAYRYLIPETEANTRRPY